MTVEELKAKLEEAAMALRQAMPHLGSVRTEIEALRMRIDLVEAIGSALPLKFDVPRSAWVGQCPWCRSAETLQVKPDVQVFHCFACSAGGDIFGWIRRMNPDASWQRVIELARGCVWR